MMQDFYIGNLQDFYYSIEREQKRYKDTTDTTDLIEKQLQQIDQELSSLKANQLSQQNEQLDLIQDIPLPNLCLQRSASIQKKFQEQELVFTEVQLSLFAWVVILFVAYIFFC